MKKKCHMSVLAQIEGGARGAPLWLLTLFSDVGPGRVKAKTNPHKQTYESTERQCQFLNYSFQLKYFQLENIFNWKITN